MATISEIDTPPTSVAPSESVSQAPKKKSKPGKNARAAAKAASGVSSNVSQPTRNVSKADTFASSARSAPEPQPGKFPVVFQTGAGEPTTDKVFSVKPSTVNDITGSLAQFYANHDKFAEFASYVNFTPGQFELEVSRAFLLSAAQQLVHAHVNMGLPLGDFSSVSSTDVYLPMALRTIVQQFGEFSVPAIGIRFLLQDYSTSVSSLVHCAARLNARKKGQLHWTYPVQQLWLPMNATDSRTRHIVAVALNEYLNSAINVSPPVSVLQEHLFIDQCHEFNALKALLPEETRNRFDFLFAPYASPDAWVSAFTGEGPQSVLEDLELFWPSPHVTDIDFNFVTKVRFPSLVEAWSKKRTTMEKYFSCGSGFSNKSSASGSPSQISLVTSSSGITKVETNVGISAPEFSLLACFPVSASHSEQLGVRMVTAIPVRNRAIEFAQKDWK